MADVTDSRPSDRPATGGGFVTHVLPWVQMILLNVVVPIVVYDVLTGRGYGEVTALLLSGVGPLLDMLITIVRSRRVDEFSVVVLAFLAVGVVTSLLFSDPRLFLLKESVATGVFGVIMLGSLVVAPRPLMFYFGRRFATGGVPARIEWWNGLWRFAGFRRTQWVITATWGTALLAEAVIRVVLTYTLPVATMVVVNNVAPLVVIGLLVLWTVTYAKRA
ncbi:VC0807 family protein, partial [Pseudonocardia sp. KRD291]|uniref:VC0807 family protein n=1 Tax=Pseudonocardia sp. KRD291 TaxID=2792007 RepID=UPI001C4A6A24